METQKSAEQRQFIDEQLKIIKHYVDGFELFLPKDDTALGEIADLMRAVAEKMKEMDDSRIKRKKLKAELDRAFSDLENSQKSFARDSRPDSR